MRSHWLSRWDIRVAPFWSFCEPVQAKVLPQSREGSSSYIPAWKFVLFLLKQQPRHWSQMVPKKTMAFCCCELSCILNSNELVCSKMEKVSSKSNETLQLQKVQSSQPEDPTALLWSYETWYDPNSNHMIILFCRTSTKVNKHSFSWLT